MLWTANGVEAGIGGAARTAIDDDKLITDKNKILLSC